MYLKKTGGLRLSQHLKTDMPYHVCPADVHGYFGMKKEVTRR